MVNYDLCREVVVNDAQLQVIGKNPQEYFGTSSELLTLMEGILLSSIRIFVLIFFFLLK